MASVPQGSILGPTLFLIFVDDNVKELETDPHLFADDVILLAEGINQMECCNKLSSDISRMTNWSKTWKIS